jgi:demethylmenaquinone methyltransferase/2-methoxy-6-polyprenyl-1,4-benzoquinol methylase
MTYSTVTTFEKPLVPMMYDALVRVMYLPVGGEAELRQSAVERLALEPGARVLELGCGTGSFTRLLLAAGARVTALDGSSRMIERAERKAPGAKYECQDLRSLRLDGAERYDLVLFGFVLHEFEVEERRVLFEQARRVLAPNGRVAIVDHAVPEKGSFAQAYRRFLLSLEPPTVRSVIERGYDAELHAAGLCVSERAVLARGAAMFVVAS